MTKHKNLKREIRSRMEKTGERYTTARMHVLGLSAKGNAVQLERSGLVDSGTDPDVIALHNALIAAGVVNPLDGEPFSDALLFGLSGGVGFLYALFEYEGWDPMLSIGVRYTMLGHDFARQCLERACIAHETFTTGSPAKADAALDDALAAGVVPLVSVDYPSLPFSGLPDHFKTMSSNQMVVVAADVERVSLDNGRQIEINRKDFQQARQAYRKAKHQMLTITGAEVGDLAGGVRSAIRATADNFATSPYKGFASNWGFAGIEKWARLLVDERDRKGWPRVFDSDALAFLAMTRVHESIEILFTPPAAGRVLYGEFLIEASAIAGIAALASVGKEFIEVGAMWAEIAAVATEDHETFDKARDIRVRREAALDELGEDAGPARLALYKEGAALGADVRFESGFVEDRFAKIANLVDDLAIRERAAIDRMATAVT